MQCWYLPRNLRLAVVETSLAISQLTFSLRIVTLTGTTIDRASIDAAAARTSPQLAGDKATLVPYPVKSTGAYRSHAIQRRCTANGEGYLYVMNTTSLKTPCESVATPTSHVKYCWIGAQPCRAGPAPTNLASHTPAFFQSLHERSHKGRRVHPILETQHR